MICCTNCFADEWLKRHIERQTPALHRCDFCEADEVSAIRTQDLRHLFSNLSQLYPLAWITVQEIQRDWRIFNTEAFSEEKQQQLLDSILGERDEPTDEELKYYYSLYDYGSDLEDYNELCTRLANIDECQEPLDIPFGPYLDWAKKTLSIGTKLYRSRRGYKGERDDGQVLRQPYTGEEMNAPPPSDKVPAGRANLKGEPVLYCAATPETAVAEMRPARGNWLSLCELRVRQNLSILDFMNSNRKPNPFTSSALSKKMTMWKFSQYYARQLSKPLEHDDDDETYRDCQEFTSEVRKGGYQGIRYQSALNPEGCNLVIFDPNLVRIGPSRLVYVQSVRIDYKVI